MIPTTHPATVPGREDVRTTKWVSPRKRPPVAPPPNPVTDPNLPPGPALLEARLLGEYCQSSGAFCCWGSLPDMMERTDHSLGSLRDRLRHLVKAGRVVRMTYDKFRSWMETDGVPVHGLAWPEKLGRKGKPKVVTIFVRRLPEPLRDPAYVWPLGLAPSKAEDVLEIQHLTCRDSNTSCVGIPTAPSYELPKGTEERNETGNFVSLDSPHGLEDGRPDPMAQEIATAPPTAAPTVPAVDSTSDAPRAPRPPLDADGLKVALDLLAQSRWPAFRNRAWWDLHDSGQLPAEHEGKPPGPRPIPDRPARPIAPALSQGKPRRSDASPPTGESDPVEAAIRAAADRSQATNARAMSAAFAAESVARSLNDLAALKGYQGQMLKLANGELTASQVITAYRAARTPKGGIPGKIFHGYLKRQAQ